MGHSKMRRLARILGVKLYGAIGIMEAIWHLTSREAPAGGAYDKPRQDRESITWTEWRKSNCRPENLQAPAVFPLFAQL